MFRVITLATSKGGVGKSSLGRSLAAHWFSVGHKPALIDADPQRTLANRYDPKGRMGSVPVVAEPEERVGDTIEELGRQTCTCDRRHCRFSKPDDHRRLGRHGPRHHPAQAGGRGRGRGDCHLRPDPRDQRDRRAGRAADQGCHGTDDDHARHGDRPPRTRTAWGAGSPLLKAEMLNRVAYPEAGIEGLSPSITDPDGAAARDIAAIAQELMKLENHEFMKEAVA